VVELSWAADLQQRLDAAGREVVQLEACVLLAIKRTPKGECGAPDVCV
jgi:hypothetical protein